MQDIMGTLGHNVMLWAENDEAYAVWMIAATGDRDKVAAWLATSKQDLDADNGFVSPEVTHFFPSGVLCSSLSLFAGVG